MSRNAEVADRLDEIADRLEATDVEYKPRAYRQAADNVRNHAVAIEQLAERGQDAVEEIDRVGDAIAAKVIEYLETGSIEELERLREELPADVVALTRVEGVGPKTVADLYEALGIEDLDDLEAAAEAGEIREVSGFGEKTERNILENLAFARESDERELLGDAIPLSERVMAHLGEHDAVERVDAAGSLRRWRATIGDVDVLVASESGEAVVDHFTAFDAETIEAGTSKASLRANGIRVDLRVVVPEEWGAALQYFTGSRDHNIALRNRAIERDLKINEYGVFDVSGVDDHDAGEGTDGSRPSSDVSDGRQRVGERVAGETEADVYAALDLPAMAPELREDRGELDTAAAGELPDLLAEDDVRGDLHLHTDWSDGDYSVAEMLEGAAAFGHDYVAVTDHATGPGMVGGVGVADDELLEQAEAVREAAAEAGVRAFAGVEANVGADGSVSVADDVLAELDCVVASPHAGLDGDGTERLVAACEHPGVNVIGHPTGRLLNQRPGLDVDVETLAAAAAATDTALEVNANPHRLDLRGGLVKAAVDAGATIAVCTDAHAPSSYEFLRYGVHTARRGWAEAGDVLNARDADEVAAFLGA